jgi:gentisate 1,2-dioxygenase
MHTREDEYSFVLEGRMGALLGGEVVHAEAGDLVFKPRDQWHTFWNAGDEPCRILEIISPGGFEGLFADLGAKLAAGEMDPAEAEKFFGELTERYGIHFDPEATPAIAEEHGLWHPIFAPKAG